MNPKYLFKKLQLERGQPCPQKHPASFEPWRAGLSALRRCLLGTLFLLPVLSVIGQVAPSAGRIQFTSTSYIASERESLSLLFGGRTNVQGARITVTRLDGAQGAVQVDYTVTNGTALNGTHYGPITNGVLSFEDYQMSADLIIPIIDDATTNDNRTFTIILSNPRAAAGELPEVMPELGPIDRTTVTILDNDLGLNFGRAYYRAGEPDGQVRVTVYLNGTSTNDVTVDYEVLSANLFQLQAGSEYATPGLDFSAASGTLTFAPNDPSEDIIIPISDDVLVEFNEDLQVQLSNPMGMIVAGTNTNEVAVVVGAIGVTTVTILFDDSFGASPGGGVTTVGPEQPAGAVDVTYNPRLVAWSRPPLNATPGANYSVYALAVQLDGQTVIGGDFTAVNTESLTRIARLDANGWVDPSFSVGTGVDGPVEAIAIYNFGPNAGKIVIGGPFTSVNGTQRQGVARLNANGTLDTSFNPGAGTDGPVRAVAIQSDGKVVIAGDFSEVNGVSRGRIARLNANGSVDLSFDPGLGADGTIWALALTDVALSQTASFSGTNVGPATNIVSSGTSAPVFFDADFGTEADMVDIFYEGSVILSTNFAGSGQFTFSYGPGTETDLVIVLNGDSTNSNTFAYTLTITPTGTDEQKIVIGGEFFSFDLANRAGIARLNTDGSVDQTFNPGSSADGPVYALAVQPDSKVLAGGAFTQVASQSRGGIARLNMDGSLDTTFDPGNGADNAVFSIALQVDGTILIAGAFREFNHVRRACVARLYSYGALDTSFADTAYNQFAGVSDPDSFVNAMGLQPDGAVMIGGTFNRVGGGLTRSDRAIRFNVARLIGGSTPGPGNVEFVSSSYRVDENGLQLRAVLMRANGMLAEISVGGTTRDGLAIAGQDYVGAASNAVWNTLWPNGLPGAPGWMVSDGAINSLTFAPALSVQILDDLEIEGDETFHLELSPPVSRLLLGGEVIPVGVALGRQRATVTIADNDFSAGEFSFSAPTFTVNENGTNAVITVVRTGGSTGSASVDYMTANGTNSPALAGSDYTARNLTLTFASGQTNRTFTVPILNDTIVEPDETFLVKLTNPRGGALLGTHTTAVVTIIDNDYAPGRLAFAAPTFSVTEAGSVATIAVRRNGGNVGAVSVRAVATDGTATAPPDFIATNLVLNWGDGDSMDKTFTITINNDGEVEGEERIALYLTNFVSGLPASQSNAVVRIIDDDFYGSLAFSSPLYIGDEIGGSAIITVVRSGGVAGTTTVNFATANLPAGPGSASSGPGGDYLSTNGTLVFLPGQLSATFTVPVLDDLATEGDEALRLMLSGAGGGATLGSPATATLSIVDDESFNVPAGSLDTSFNPNAGANGTINALALQTNGGLVLAGEFTSVNGVTRNHIARLLDDGNLDGSFDPGVGFNGSARALALQSDGRIVVGGFFSTINGTNRNQIARLNGDGTVDVSFNPGAGADNPVNALAITTVNGSRKVLVGGAFSAINSVIRNGIARLNDNGSVDNGFDPGMGANGPVFAIAVQADGKVLVGGDFTVFNGSPAAFLVRLNADGSRDPTFNIGSGANASVRALAIQTDGRIVVGGAFTSFRGASLPHVARLNLDGTIDSSFDIGLGADGAVLAILPQVDGKLLLGGQFVSFDGVSRNRITRLNADGSVDPSINFGSGANNFISALAVQPDRKIILAGGFTTFNDQPRNHLARLHGGSLAGSGSLEFAAPLFTANENNTSAIVVVRRSGGTIGTVSINYSVIGGSATPGNDYTLADGILTFPEGETRQTILVTLINDTLIENDETVQLELSSPTGGAILGGQPTTTLNIVSDDSVVSFSSSTFTVIENIVTGNATISVVRTGAVSGTVTVNYSATAGSATAGQDFTAVSGTIQFAPGETIKTFIVPILDDTLPEGNETVNVRLSNLTGPAVLRQPLTAVLTINENDFSPGSLSFAAPSYRVAEGNTTVSLTVIRTNGSSGAVSVRYSTINRTATAGSDYVAADTALAFGDGELSRTLTISLLPDSLVEGNETFDVVLSQPTGGATLGSLTRVSVTIDDDDFGPGSLDPQFDPGTGANALVRALTVQTDGRIIIGGAFTQFNGYSRNFIARLNSNGAVDLTFNPGSGANGIVSAVGLDAVDGDVLLGGSFTVVNSAGRSRFARLTSSGTVDLNQDQPTGLDAAVYALAAQADSKVVVGGTFISPKAGLARLRVNGSVDTSFDTGSGADGAVFAVALGPTGEVVAGGSFSTFDGAIRSRVAKLMPDGSLDLGFIPPTISGGSVFAVAFQSDGKVIVGGDFATVAGQSRNGIARLNANGSLDTGFTPGSGANGPIYGVAIQADGKIVVVGGFTSISGATRNRIARLNLHGTLDAGFNPGLGANNTVYTLALLGDGKILIGGDFTSVNGFDRNGIARLNGDAAEALQIRPGFGFSANTFRLEVNAVAGRRYAIDISADLINWSPLATNTAMGPVLEFIDNTPAPSRRFYRAREVSP